MVTKRTFGKLSSGEEIQIFHLENKAGAYAEISQFGAILVKLCVSDREGKLTDVVLGYDDLAGYEVNGCFFGATIGRSGNRIADSRFVLDGQEITLTPNEGKNNLHSGPNGFEKKIWNAAEISEDKNAVTFSRISPDGENGFPGEFQVSVTYEMTENNELRIVYGGVCDRTTVANMTNHSYFNLDGDPTTDNSAYLLTLNADNYTPIDSTFMTTGEIATVEGTPMDFRKPTAIGANINQEFEQLKSGNGIDHNWVLNTQGDVTKVCATLESPKTGIVLDVYTNEPGIQVYCGNFLDGTLTGKKGIVYNFRAAVCLETDKYPDTPNKPEWPSAVLRPGEKYQSQCIYKFSVHK